MFTELAKAFVGFCFQLTLFSLTFVAAWAAWRRDSRYKLEMNSAQECLLGFYTFSDAFRAALTGPGLTALSTGHGDEEAIARARAEQQTLDAAARSSYAAFRQKLRIANLHIKMPRYDIVRSPLADLKFYEDVKDCLRAAAYVNEVRASGTDVTKNAEYKFATAQLFLELKPEDLEPKGIVVAFRDDLEQILIPYTKPREIGWSIWRSRA